MFFEDADGRRTYGESMQEARADAAIRQDGGRAHLSRDPRRRGRQAAGGCCNSSSIRSPCGADQVRAGDALRRRSFEPSKLIAHFFARHSLRTERQWGPSRPTLWSAPWLKSSPPPAPLGLRGVAVVQRAGAATMRGTDMTKSKGRTGPTRLGTKSRSKAKPAKRRGAVQKIAMIGLKMAPIPPEGLIGGAVETGAALLAGKSGGYIGRGPARTSHTFRTIHWAIVGAASA